ncbi:MAG: NifU family protein [Bacteroidota bacterium]
MLGIYFTTITLLILLKNLDVHTISIKPTSNEAILKFESNQPIIRNESFEFSNIDEAKPSPLAQQLFYLPFVKKIYLSGNFVAIERFDIIDWNDVKEEVSQQIENFLNSGDEVLNQSLVKPSKKIPVTVYAESTPNPSVLKFVANKKLVNATYEFNSIDEANFSPFATALFHFAFVKGVFIDENYVSITKYDRSEWTEITSELREFIKIYVEDGKIIVDENSAQVKAKSTEALDENYEKLDDTSKEIVNILEEYVKPAVASDGGNIVFQSYDPKSKKVSVILQGACSGCPSSTFTLKSGIENMLREMMKGRVETVEAING